MNLEGAISGRRAPMIYAIYSSAERAAYVGSTTRTAYSRYATHRGQLRAGIHHCSALQVAWQRFGEDAFKMVILETLESAADLLSSEYRWMQTAEGDGYAIYNPQALQCRVCSAPLRAHGRVRYCSDACKLKAWRARRRSDSQEASEG